MEGGSSTAVGGTLDVMTGANGGVDPASEPGWRWDVALSFAGAQRPYVEQVAEALKAWRIRCFYDADEQIDLWGKYLAEELPAIYGEQAAAVVVFVSAEYVARDWTRLERRAALSRAVRERREYVLPARFDNTPLPGLLSDMVAIDLRHLTPQQFAAMISGKLATLAEPTDLSRASGATQPSTDRQARLDPDPAEVRSSPGAWETDYDIGDVIDGRFEILQELGQGGFPKVYRVHDDVEGTDRVLKLFATGAGHETGRREIGALRETRHPNLVEVIWAGQTWAGTWYLITEFIDGESLEEFVTGKRNLRDREAVDVALGLLDALAAFHPGTEGKGLIHRAIKPRNVMLTRAGPKLLDFNIASWVGDPAHMQSGTPPYQAPDADFTRWDVSTDLFAVGVLLYQLLCHGSHPYPDAMPTVDGLVIDPRTVRPDLGADLAEFLIKACAPVSRDRFYSAGEMQLALRNVRASL